MFEFKQVYCFADPTFFDDPVRWTGGPGYLTEPQLEIAGRDVPVGWLRKERGFWTSLRPAAAAKPEQGWKIHVSGTLDNADAICTEVWDYCVAAGLPFKHLANRNVLLLVNSKYAPRNASGKLLTLYPENAEQLRRTIDELGAILDGEPGPYILSDLRIGNGPLYVRYGAFIKQECVDDAGEVVAAIRNADGELVPDRRTPVFRPPAWVTIPGFLQPHLDARKSGGRSDAPYRVTKTLHFSNGGGVYLATRLGDGRAVVLKEARPHAALDDNHEDAVTRLRRERWAMEQLRGLDGIPECHDWVSAGGHEFLVQEYVDGQPLHVWHACNHPWVTTIEPTAGQLADYTRRVLDICRRVEAVVDAMHDRGIAFGDLHIGNVIVRPDDSVTLIDFELAHRIGDPAWRPGLKAPGYALAGTAGVERDRYALAALQLACFLSLSRVIALDHSKITQHVAVIERSFPVPPGWGDGIRERLGAGSGDRIRDRLDGSPHLAAEEVNWAARGKSIAEAILLSATPDREDRLFPGDTKQFTLGGQGFAYGAAGVLWALSATGHGRYPEHEKWLLAAIDREPPKRGGFYDGAAGLAWVLDDFGYHERAAGLLAGLTDDRIGRLGMTLFAGQAGVALTLLDLAGRHDQPVWLERALAAGERLAAAVTTGDPAAVRGARSRAAVRVDGGLLRGWSGPALAFLRLFDHTGDEKWLDLAVRAIHRDLDLCVPTGDGSLQVEEVGVRTLGYLEVGSAGVAVVIDELLRRRADERARQSMRGLLLACCRPYTIQSDLFKGRAGLLAAISRLAAWPDGPDLHRAKRMHLANLGWHAVGYRGHLAFPIDFRLSMDLASGGAGVLLAITDGPFLPFFTATDSGGTGVPGRPSSPAA